MRPSAVVALLTVIVWIGLASPLIVAFPESVDWPGHVTRHALAAMLPGDPVLDGFYTIGWRAIPNLGADLAMLVLEPLFGASLGSRVLLAAAMGGLVAGPLLVQRALWGRTTAWPLVGSLFVYNAVLYMGFENFYVTAPLAMAAFAAWIASEGRISQPARHLGLAAAALAIWFGHLVIYGLLAVLVGAWELGRPSPVLERLRGAALAGVAFVPGLALFVRAQLTAPATHGGGTVWSGGAAQKLGLLLSPVLQYDPPVDLALLLFVLPLIGVAVLAAGRPRLHPRMAVVLAVLGVLTVLMPARLMGVGFMDQRLPPLLLGLLVGSLDVRFDRGPGLAVGALVAVALTARVATTHARWRRHAHEVAEVVAIADQLPPGWKVLAAGAVEPRHFHTSAWLVPRARVFVPNLFTGAHLLGVTPAVAALDHPTPDPPTRELLQAARDGTGRFATETDVDVAWLRSWWTDFDALLWLEDGPPPDVGPLDVVARGSWFTLYRLPEAAP